MKTLSLFILTFLMLYNPKVLAADIEISAQEIERLEIEINRVEIKIVNPLKEIDTNLTSFNQLLNAFNDFKYHNLVLSKKLHEKIEKNNTFSGDELYLIKRTFDVFYKLNSKMMAFGETYHFKTSTMSKTFSNPDQKIPMVKAHLIWISSNLLVLNHIQEIHNILYAQNGSLRRMIKSTVSDKKIDALGREKLKEVSDQFNRAIEIGENAKFQQHLNLVRSIQTDLEEILDGETHALSLINEIVNNPTAKEIFQGRVNFKLTDFAAQDAIVGFFSKVTNLLSGIFGNIAGSIQWRKGFLFENKSALEIARASLKPMDIIFEKSPFVLTDKFIPGYYGHVAMYLGTKEQLMEIGMWDHPAILPYHQEIENGKIILEAVRSGVRLNTLEEFMNIDEFTVVRKEDNLASPEKIYQQISRGMDQIGKSYDFNFDITTLDKIVCSELVFIVFGNVNWPTRYRVGRATVTPDDLSEILFQKGTPFKITNYMLSTKRHRIEIIDINHLANVYDYELRSSNGDEAKDPKDPTNSFWKKETKCYNVSGTHGSSSSESQTDTVKECRTVYKEFYYEEAS